MFKRQFWVCTDKCLIILLDHGQRTLMAPIINKVTYFFVIYRFLNWNDRLYENLYIISRKRTGLCSQYDSLFANRWLPPLNLHFYFLKRALWIWGIVFCCFNFLKLLSSKINVLSVYRVILRYLSWTSSIAEHRREHAVIQDWWIV